MGNKKIDGNPLSNSEGSFANTTAKLSALEHPKQSVSMGI
jgi:hypothetical protein